MFTGIVREIGCIGAVRSVRGGRAFDIGSRTVRRGLRIGDSVSVSGTCLTASLLKPGWFRVEAVPETLRLTTLGFLGVGHKVNLEPAARLNEIVGGHLVSGHVDGLGRVRRVLREGNGRRITVEAPSTVARYLVPKGSVCVDGVSLTLAALGPPAPGHRAAGRGMVFEIALIPHTLSVTTLGKLAAGDRVNLEADLIAKHVAHLLGKRR
jgi:riboflavin synthase